MRAALILLIAQFAFSGIAVAMESPSTAEYKAQMETMHRKMNAGFTGDTDTDFAVGMAPHHQAAVEMAKTELKYGKDPFIRWLASAIITAQEEEIGLLERWIAVRGYRLKGCNAASIAEFKEANDKMHHAMMAFDYTGDADLDFVLGMIPHHQGAVDMAEVQLRYGSTKAMNKLALGIARSQASEIRAMENWLAKQPAAPHITEEEHAHHAPH